jgi:hypothetical protein
MASLIFTDIDQIKQYADVSKNTRLESFNSSIRVVQNEVIVPLIGRTMLNTLLGKLDDDSLDDDEKVLLDKLRSPAALLTKMYHSPENNITETSGGFTVPQGENIAPASRWRINDFLDSLEYKAQIELNELLLYLEENGQTFSDYWNSDERTQNMSLFVPRASIFQKYTSLKVGHFMFSRLAPVIERIQETVIQNCICPDLYTFLKAKLESGTDLDDYAPILPYIQRAIVHLTLSDALDEMNLSTKSDNLIVKFRESNTLDTKGQDPAPESTLCRLQRRNTELAREAISALKKHLDDNTDTYIVYADSECSTPTILPETTGPTSGSGVGVYL